MNEKAEQILDGLAANGFDVRGESGMRYRCNRCHRRPMRAITCGEDGCNSGACECGGLIEADPHNYDLPSLGPWEAHDDDGTGTLSCVLSEHVHPSGTFYVAQCNRFSDAQFIAAAPEVADALEAFRDARMLIVQEAREEALLVADMLAEAALRKAGRLS